MADKLLKYDVAMKSTKTVWQMETPICYTGDENTVTFDFNIIDLEEADLVGVIPNVYLYMRDGSFFQKGPADGVEITGTTVNYTMKGNEGKHSGIAKAQLVLVWDDEVNPPEKLTSQMYAFEVVSGLENKVAVEVMIQDWTTLTREARTFIDTSADEVDALKGELQTAITTANTSLGEFDVALQNGIVATNIAAELQNLEETYAPDLFTVKQQLEQAAIFMVPQPSDRVTNTNNLQTILDYATNGRAIKVKFPAGVFELDMCFINANTEIELQPNTVLKSNPIGETPHLFRNVRPTDINVTGYNGAGNITIRGGQVLNSHVLSAIHGKNILIENLTVLDNETDHLFEIAACKDYTIRNCTFRGMKTQSPDRNYVEYVQLDPCEFNSFPWLPNGSPTYDGTPNSNIVIEGCTFEPSTTLDYDNVYACIGSHSESAIKHESLTIRNNTFKNAKYAAVSVVSVEKTILENNTFINCSRDLFINGPYGEIEITKNKFNESTNGIMGYRTGGRITIADNDFEGVTNANIELSNPSEVSIKRNSFKNTNYVYLLNTIKKVNIESNIFENLYKNCGDAVNVQKLNIVDNVTKDATITGENLYYISDCTDFTIRDNIAVSVNRNSGVYYFVKINGANMQSAFGLVKNNKSFNSTNYLKETIIASTTFNPSQMMENERYMLLNGAYETSGATITLPHSIEKFNVLFITTGTMGGSNYKTHIVCAWMDTFRINDKFIFDTTKGIITMQIVSLTSLSFTGVTVGNGVRHVYGIKYKTI